MTARAVKQHWIGFDLGGTKMLGAVLDARFRVVAAARHKSKGAAGARKGIDRIVATVGEVLEQAALSRRAVAGIGIGVPGFVDLERGVVLQAPNLGWRDVPLRKALEKRFGVPVVVANDVDAGTFGEYQFGAGQRARCVVGVFPGTGIGGGCVYEGRVLRGRAVSCMEIGHIPVQPGGALCGCGRRGCLETVASRLAIAAEAAQAAYRGEAPYLLAHAGTDLSLIRSGVIHAAIKGGDKVVERIVRRAARHIGVALAGVVDLLAPDVIVLGGGLAEEMPSLFVQEVESTLRKGVVDAFHDTFRVVPAQLGDYATVMGVAALAAQARAGTA